MSENDSETPTGQPDGGLAEDVIVLPRGPQAEVVTLESGAFSGVQATVEQKRESVRAWIALMLLAIFGLTVIAALLAVIFSDAESQVVKDLLEVLLPAETALLGSAVGFYFGAESRN